MFIYCNFSCWIGLTGSVILRSGKLSDILSELQELMTGVNEIEIQPGKYDSAALAAQVFEKLLKDYDCTRYILVTIALLIKCNRKCYKLFSNSFWMSYSWPGVAVLFMLSRTNDSYIEFFFYVQTFFSFHSWLHFRFDNCLKRSGSCPSPGLLQFLMEILVLVVWHLNFFLYLFGLMLVYFGCSW